MLLQAVLCYFPRARLFPWNAVFAHGALIGFIYAYIRLYCTVDFKVQCLASSAVDKANGCDNFGSEALKKIFYLHCGLSCCYHILCDYNPVSGSNFKTSSQAHFIVFSLGEKGFPFHLPAKFVSRYYPTHCGTHKIIQFQVFYFFHNLRNHQLCLFGKRQNLCALHVTTTVLSGRKQKMPFKNGSRLFEYFQQFFLIHVFLLYSIPLISDRLFTFSLSMKASISSTILVPALKSIKFAVPTCTQDAPAIMNEIASAPFVIPPMPIIGTSTAFATWWTILKAIGRTAGPDSPAYVLSKMIFLLYMSTAIA